VAIPPGATALDYELEVAAYIGRPGRDIAPEDAEGHIAGYTILNDWSARDLQVVEMRQMLGPAKGKDSATTMGPMFVTPDELEPYRAGNGHRLAMTASVDGKPYSRGDWSTLHWSFGQMIAYASRGTRLVPGDVIGSGTVGTGCILELSRVHGPEAYPYLQPGDEVTLEVEGLGAISNVVVPGAPVIPLE
jgi:2-keto-4-pentenoate hydratase/2-oxohepta-3-ene-1,7-dioic acid hydratase in catechol pathway